jgi:hypothetical protein
MESSDPSSTHADEESPVRRGLPLLPLVILAACGVYFGYRFWESREHIHLLLAGINLFGVVTILTGWRRSRRVPGRPY